MKKLLVFVFLLVLFLIPAHPVAATYGDVSPQSITSFAETSENNQMVFLGTDGWQHDCSTTANVSSVGTGKVTLSSDSDIMTITNTESGSPNAASFWINQSSQEVISRTSYPFLSINVTAVQAGGEWSLSLYDNSTLTEIQSATNATGVFRYNIKAGYASDPNQIYIYARGIISNNKWIKVSWVKIYSIANWTVTQGSVDTDEFLYTSNNILTIGTTGEMDYSYYFLLNYDPTLLVATSTYTVWNLSVSSDNDYSNLKFNIGGWGDWQGWGETRGSLLSGSLVDIQLEIAESTDGATVSAIKFIDTHSWHEVNSLPIYFVVPISAATLWALNGWYMVLGAGMVVFSTCFAAIKIKSREGGIDDILIFLVLFVFGWALIIGSVM